MRNQIIVQSAVLISSDRGLHEKDKAPLIDVTQQISDLFLNESKTSMYIPKTTAAKTLLLLLHYKDAKGITSKPLEFINNRYFRNMKEVTLQIVLYFADARVQVDLKGNEALYLFTVSDVEIGCELTFDYAKLMTTKEMLTDENKLPIAVEDNLEEHRSLATKDVSDVISSKIYKTRVRNTVIQRVCVNSREELHPLFSNAEEATRLKVKFRVNDYMKRVEVLSADESMTVVSLCDMGANNSLLNENIALKPIRTVAPLIHIDHASYSFGEKVKNVTKEVQDLVCYNRLMIPNKSKSFMLETFFHNEKENGRLEVTYTVNGKSITVAVTNHECLAVIAADVSEELDRLRCISAGRFTAHMLNDATESVRKRIVNNCIYIRQNQISTFSFMTKLRSSFGKISDSLQYYVYSVMRYGDYQLFWMSEQNDGMKIITHRANSNAEMYDPEAAHLSDEESITTSNTVTDESVTVLVPSTEITSQQTTTTPRNVRFSTEYANVRSEDPASEIISQPEPTTVLQEQTITTEPVPPVAVSTSTSPRIVESPSFFAKRKESAQLTVTEEKVTGKPVVVDNRLLETLDAISIQAFSQKFTLGDLFIRSDFFILIIGVLWLFFIITDPGLFRWLGAFMYFGRATVDLMGHIVQDTVVALALYSIVYFSRYPEVVPNFLNTFRNTQYEVEKVKVAKESVLGKMFDMYVWLVKKTQRRAPMIGADVEDDNSPQMAEVPADVIEEVPVVTQQVM